MIHLNGVTDEPYAFGSRQPLLAGADLDIPVGRYALLSPAPELHRQIVDVLCGLRPPRQASSSMKAACPGPSAGRVSFAARRPA